MVSDTPPAGHPIPPRTTSRSPRQPRLPSAAKDASFHDDAHLAPEKLSHGEIDAYLGAPGELTIGVDAFLEGLGLP